jgi:hypothetical protein
MSKKKNEATPAKYYNGRKVHLGDTIITGAFGECVVSEKPNEYGTAWVENVVTHETLELSVDDFADCDLIKRIGDGDS